MTVALKDYLDQYRSWLPGGSNGGPSGYIEGPNNDTIFGRWFGLNNNPWCLMFAQYCADHAGMPLPYRSAGTRNMAQWLHDHGLLSPVPQPGALGLFFAGHAPGTGHAITVEALDPANPNTFWTIEGNADVAGGRTGGRVIRLKRSTANCGTGGGFYHPSFASSSPAPPPPTQKSSRPRLSAPLVKLVPCPGGYWEVGADGGVFAFGQAPSIGSLGNIHLSAPIVSAAGTPTGRGMWLVGRDGGVFALGDAQFYGSTNVGGIKDIVATPSGKGYWLMGENDGGVFAYGDAPFYGSVPEVLDAYVN